MTTLLKKVFFLAVMFSAAIVSAQTKADGMIAFQLEKWDKAIDIYSAVVKADPADQDARLTLGNMYLAKGDKAKAGEQFQAAFDAKADGPLAFVALARIALLKDDIQTADENLKRAATKGKKDAVVLRQRGESYLFYVAPGSKKASLTRCEELLKEAVEINSKDYATLMALAYCYKEMPDGGRAALNYEYAELADPKNPLPKLMLALVYKAAKVPEKPLQYFDKAIAAQPNFTPALRGKADYLYFARKWEDATKAYKELVAKGAEVVIEDEMQLANCLFITKDCVGCAELVAKILAKDGSKNYLRRLLAYCDYENGNYQRGLQILDEYFKIVTPDKVLVSDYEYHGNLLIKGKGDTLRAIEDYRTAIKMDTTGGRWPLNKDIGDMLYTRKDQCGAAEAYGRYIDSLPSTDANYATYLYKLGLSQYYCKSDSLRFDKSLVTFKKITEVKPTATIGWLWSAKAAATKDPSPDEIAANPELANEYGKAHDYYEKYAELAAADKVKNKKDLLTAYQYLSYCHFVKKEEATFNNYIGKWLELETDPEKQKPILEMKDAFGKEEPPVDPNAPKGKN